MSDLKMIWTDAGYAALVNAENTGTLPVECAEIAIGTGTTPAAKGDTELEAEIKRVATIAGQNVDANTLHVILRDETADTYEVHEVGLIAADGTLLARYAQADPITTKVASSVTLLAIDASFVDVDTAQISFPSADFVDPPWSETIAGVVKKATQAAAESLTDNILGMTAKRTAQAIAAWLNATAPGHGNGLDADTVDGHHADVNATADTVAARDAGGRLRAAQPINADDVARKAETDQALKKTQNLKDLTNVQIARTNLGLGSAATKNVGTGATDVPQNQNLGGAAYKNMGAGNGLDADLLDGQHGSYYRDYNNLNNKPLLFSGSYNDLSDKPTIPTNNNQLTNGAGYAKVAQLFSRQYADLIGTPTIPTNNNQLANGAGYITGIDALDINNALGYVAADKSKIPTNNNQLTNGAGYITAAALSGYALTSQLFSGAYADLSGKPTIPTNNTQLSNGRGYITSASLRTDNTQIGNGRGYITGSSPTLNSPYLDGNVWYLTETSGTRWYITSSSDMFRINYYDNGSYAGSPINVTSGGNLHVRGNIYADGGVYWSTNDGGGGSTIPPACPTGDTPILLPDGSTVRADELAVNQQVASLNLADLDPTQESAYEDYSEASIDGSEREPTTVTAVEPAHVPVLYRIVAGEHSLRVSPEHPFLVYDGENYVFKQASDLTLDDSLVQPDETLVPVESTERLTGSFRVYKISCEPYDLYVTAGVVGHNLKQ